ncbi:MAG: 3-dehydroquinate synthase [Gemmatimonadota bacterium]|nr:MAG: 3-dehydroquinate synthase [Gemmatimonadota bacterium]
MRGEETSPVRVRVPGRQATEYEVRIERGIFRELAALCRRAAPAHRYAIIADSKVASLYGRPALEAFGEPREGAASGAGLFSFPAGEWNKTSEEWARLSDELAAEGFGRDGAIVALGGGVTGDLAGFVAATYMRGVALVQVPTSLLAMLDSSIGGKTGLDTLEAKNLLGAFHQPRLVLIDPELLRSLPTFQLASGLAEAVKAGAIADERLFGWMESHAAGLLNRDVDLLTELIRRSVAIKAAVVEQDPLEDGLREILNFGHTIGHALEALGGYEVLHGEAVACGMRLEARLGELLGVTREGPADRLRGLLEACALDRQVEEEFTAEQVLKAARGDKKVRGSVIRCVLLSRIGEVATAAGGGHAHRIPPDRELELLEMALRSKGGSADCG